MDGIDEQQDMDPLTQGLLGAAASQAVFTKPLGRRALPIGLVGGMLPDADVILSVWSDPALPQELHRHFTHALVFIPVGGLLAVLPFLCFSWYRRRLGAVCAAATLACATHGWLDCCTSYGTYWLWPFSSARLAWDVMSIIDPIFTLVLLVGVVWGAWVARAKPVMIGVLVAALYVGFGFVQHGRAVAMLHQRASQRGHIVQRYRAMPTLGNLIVWRCLYVHEQRIYSQAVRAGWRNGTAAYDGGSVVLYDVSHVPSETNHRERIVDVLQRFSHFADGYTASAQGLPAGSPYVVADMRYSADTAGFEPLWGIRVDLTDENRPVSWGQFRRNRQAAIAQLWREVIGE